MKAASAGLGVAVALMLVAAAGWACVPRSGGSKSKLTVSPARARPGDQITVTAPSSAARTPIEIRLNTADGPLLGSIPGEAALVGAGSVVTTFRLPTDTRPGHHALVAVQAGQRWEPVALAVTLPDGTVPDSGSSAADSSQDLAGGRKTVLWGAIGVVIVALGAVAARATLVARGEPTQQSAPARTSGGPVEPADTAAVDQ